MHVLLYIYDVKFYCDITGMFDHFDVYHFSANPVVLACKTCFRDLKVNLKRNDFSAHVRYSLHFCFKMAKYNISESIIAGEHLLLN